MHPPHLNSDERDALYKSIVIRLSGIGDILLAVDHQDWVAADRLAGEFAALLCLIRDLGWGDEGTRVALSTPPDLLQRALKDLNERAQVEDSEESEMRKELDAQAKCNQLVRQVCARHLTDLDEVSG
jgi:hypothetical protein